MIEIQLKPAVLAELNRALAERVCLTPKSLHLSRNSQMRDCTQARHHE